MFALLLVGTDKRVCPQVFFSLLVQSSEGATYGVVPFVSKRSMGVVSGVVGAGGNTGSVITQALFFSGGKYEARAPLHSLLMALRFRGGDTLALHIRRLYRVFSLTDRFRAYHRSFLQVYEGLIYMGVMVLCMTATVVPIYFPMWGSMFLGPKTGVTEEDYYLGEFTEAERAAGLADAALKFAQVCFVMYVASYVLCCVGCAGRDSDVDIFLDIGSEVCCVLCAGVQVAACASVAR